MKAVISHRKDLTPDIVSIYFEPEEKLDFLAGQYVEVTFPDEVNAFIGDNRWFTLSASPSEKLLTITTRLNKPLSDFKSRLVNLKRDQEIILSEPIGDFVLPIDKTIPLVFVCGGIGVTPVRSIIKFLVDEKEQRQVTINYIVKHEQDLIFKDLFSDYSASLRPIITNTKGLTNMALDELIDGHTDKSLFYVSGPQLLVEDIVDKLERKYVNSQVIMDYFPGYSTI